MTLKEAAQKLIDAKKAAENDELYEMNYGIHDINIQNCFVDLEKALRVEG